MNIDQYVYYQEMLKRNRLIPIRAGERLAGFITFYIGSDSDRYVRDNPWSVLDDEEETGTVCFVDQLITDKMPENKKYSLATWRDFRNYIRGNFPQVRVIRWNRYKGGRVYVYYKTIAASAVQEAAV